MIKDSIRFFLGLMGNEGPDRILKIHRDYLNHKVNNISYWDEDKFIPESSKIDTIAFYVYQAMCYDRSHLLLNKFKDQCALNYDYQEGSRIIPIMETIGRHLSTLLSIPGAKERAQKIVNEDRKQPDSGLFELLVALAYRRDGYSLVEFVPEKPPEKTPDLRVGDDAQNCILVECKKLTRYGEHEERERKTIEISLTSISGILSRKKKILDWI